MASIGPIGRDVYITLFLAASALAAKHYTRDALNASNYMKTLGERDKYVEDNLDSKSLSYMEIPHRLRKKAVYKDADGDGDFESYIRWYNRFGPDAIIKMVRSSGNGFDFPTVSDCAMMPDEAANTIGIDYHYINNGELMESVAYTFDYQLSPISRNFRITPIRIEKLTVSTFGQNLRLLIHHTKKQNQKTGT